MSSVEFFFEDITTIEINRQLISSEIEYLISNENKRTGDLSLIFCSDEYLLDINKQYLKHDYYTDIVTFNYVSGDLISGDLFISIDRVSKNATKFKVNFTEELYRVIFHGVLHLVGYNDISNSEKKVMRNKENEYLERIVFGN